MDETRVSVTAVVTALMRAVHTRLGSPPLIDDPWGDRLILGAEGDRPGHAWEVAAVEGDRLVVKR
jgi:O-methyltransferase involved in polyketide biosynthesis